MLFIQGNEQKWARRRVLIRRRRGASLKHPVAGNLSAIVDADSVNQRESGARRNQRIQIDHRTMLPKKRAPDTAVTRNRNTAHLSQGVDAPCLTEAVRRQGPEIRNNAVFPYRCIVRPIGKTSTSGYDPVVIDYVCVTEAASRALGGHVNQFRSVPKEWIEGLVAC